MRQVPRPVFASKREGGRLWAVRLCAALATAFVVAEPEAAHAAGSSSKGSTEVALVSDIHFDPFSLKAVPQTPNVKGFRPWRRAVERIVVASRDANLSGRVTACTGSDPTTSMPIMDGAAKFVREQAPTAVIVSGDLLVQQFECKFRVVFPQATSTDYLDFAAGTARFVLWKFKVAAAFAPVIFAPGNHDSGCGNYRRDINDPFLSALADDVGELASSKSADRRRISREFRSNGSYRVPNLAGVERLDALVIDTTPLSRNGAGCGRSPGADPTAIINWTGNQLAGAATAGRRVWVVGHIPPGVDVRASIRPSGGIATPIRFYRNSAFDDLLAEHASTIGLALFGHTHMDEFRHPSGVLVKIVPAVSPGSGNDPAAVIAKLNSQGSIADYAVYRGDPLSPKMHWTKYYDFNDSYSVHGFNLVSLQSLNFNSNDGDNYRRNYFVSSRSDGFLNAPSIWSVYRTTHFGQ